MIVLPIKLKKTCKSVVFPLPLRPKIKPKLRNHKRKSNCNIKIKIDRIRLLNVRIFSTKTTVKAINELGLYKLIHQ